MFSSDTCEIDDTTEGTSGKLVLHSGKFLTISSSIKERADALTFTPMFPEATLSLPGRSAVRGWRLPEGRDANLGMTVLRFGASLESLCFFRCRCCF